jgi:Domain of unknown function (DUF1843)
MAAPQPPYGVAIHRAIAQGDLARMKQVAKDAEAYLREVGDLPSALTLLKIEIAKAEKKA